MSLPRHIAIIMDGNGRWAQARGLPRHEGHRAGGEVVRKVTEHCAALELEQLTLYCLSSENWKRPQGELDFLMLLLKHYLIDERKRLMDNNIRLAIIGSRERIPAEVLEEMDRSLEISHHNSGLTLCLAINYGSRQEIIDAVRAIAKQAAAERLFPEQIDHLVDEAYFEKHLDTAGMPEPDLLIRTAGEMRLSNYLLWQLSYAEIWVTETFWPDFDERELDRALHDFSRRERRFGGLKSR